MFEVHEYIDDFEKYRNLYENSPDMHISVNPKNAEIIDCNKTLLLKTNYTRDQIIGQPIFSLYHPSCLTKVKKAFKQFVETGHVNNEELVIKKKNGRKIPVLLNVEAVRDSTGNIIYSNSSWRDITEIKSLQKQLRAANRNLEKKVRLRTKELERKNRELSQFTYIASHDLQEPLRTIMSFTELIEKKYKGKLDKKTDKYLFYIVQSSQRMSSLIKGLLDYGRIGRQKETLDIDLNELIETIKVDLNTVITETDTTFTIEHLPKIKGFENELRMLFQNLITNAIKFRKKHVKPHVKIKAEQRCNTWLLSIEDNGIGIAEAHKERIFSIFQRLHTKSEYEGTGIGLAHCSKVAELHGGKIWVESKPNKGSTFFITLKNE